MLLTNHEIKWLLGNVWTLPAQCYWWGVIFSDKAFQHSGNLAIRIRPWQLLCRGKYLLLHMHACTNTNMYNYAQKHKKPVMSSSVYEPEVIMSCTYSGIRIYVRHVGEIDAACLHPMHAAYILSALYTHCTTLQSLIGRLVKLNFKQETSAMGLVEGFPKVTLPWLIS